MVAFVAVLFLLLGYYGRQMYDMLKELYVAKYEEREAAKAGVVRPIGTRLTKNIPNDTDSQSGGVRRLTNEQLIAERSIQESMKRQDDAVR